MKENQSALWKKIEEFKFCYPLFQIWKLHPKRIKIIEVLLLILVILGIIYSSINNNLGSNEITSIYINDWVITIFIVVTIVLLSVLCFSGLVFRACIYSKWVELQFDHFYKEYKNVKILQYFENWDEYIKLIFTQTDDLITTETLLYNPKMDNFLERFQGSFQNNWISCERISNTKGIDISNPVDYKVHFSFLTVLRLLSKKERRKRIEETIKHSLIRAVIFFVVLISIVKEVLSRQLSPCALLIMFWILFVIFAILYMLSSDGFSTTIENNAVWIDDFEYYILSKIKAKTSIVKEWNIEIVSLTIDNWKKTKTYKWPRHPEVERFCNDLFAEIKKRQEV